MNNLPARLLQGDPDVFSSSYREFREIPSDMDLTGQEGPPARTKQTTIENPVTLSGSGTFSGKSVTTITFEPTGRSGWWLKRTDLPASLPIRVAVDNVWTTGAIVSNIVLRSGSPHNYVRMVEHIVSLRTGLDIDNLMIKIDSGDPPLFARGSMDLVEALDRAGRRTVTRPVQYVTVKEPVALCWNRGQFLILSPQAGPNPELIIDAAVNFPNVMGKQRVRFPIHPVTLRAGAEARTNTSYGKMLYCKTIGKIFADIRNLGYTSENILIARKKRYHNQPRLFHNGKALEAIWHRAVLDLPAALALIPEARFAGTVTSYKAGHRLDCDMITQLYLHDLLTPVEPSGDNG